MLQEDRFLKIVEYLKEKPIATFAELSECTGASIGTIRRDLVSMEKSGMLQIVRGGAAACKDDISKQDFDMRGIKHRQEKREAAKLLKNIVIDGQAIGLNSGTTNIEVARFLVENYKRLTVVTNNLQIVNVLREAEGFTVIVPGGMLNGKEYSVSGKDAEAEICSYNFDVSILAVNAISLEKGITDFRTHEIGIIKAFIKAANQKVVVADHSKFERVSYMNICNVDEVDCILSDGNLTEEQVQKFRENGGNVLIPKVVQGGEFN